MKKCERCKRVVKGGDLVAVIIIDGLPYPKGTQGKRETGKEVRQWCLECVRSQDVFRPYH